MDCIFADNNTGIFELSFEQNMRDIATSVINKIKSDFTNIFVSIESMIGPSLSRDFNNQLQIRRGTARGLGRQYNQLTLFKQAQNNFT